jgi:heme a synthase
MNFQKFGILTIVAVYLLIFVGGVVRSTGSGMGCPDWPKCFGTWIPPTHIDQLPLNYQEIYGAKLKGEVIFNPVKTWIEYLNRLLGVLIGFFVFGSFLFSLKYWKTKNSITKWSAIAVLLTGFQGWVGSKVVSTELAHYMVSIHMLIAILIVIVLIYALYLASFQRDLSHFLNKKLFFLLSLVFLFTSIQIVFGIQVRGKIDELVLTIGESGRNIWIENVGMKFFIHRSFSILVLILHGFLFFEIRKSFIGEFLINKLNYILITIIGFEIFSGVILNYLGFPAIIQPIHLTLAALALGLQIFLLFSFSYNKNWAFNKLN